MTERPVSDPISFSVAMQDEEAAHGRYHGIYPEGNQYATSLVSVAPYSPNVPGATGGDSVPSGSWPYSTASMHAAAPYTGVGYGTTVLPYSAESREYSQEDHIGAWRSQPLVSQIVSASHYDHQGSMAGYNQMDYIHPSTSSGLVPNSMFTHQQSTLSTSRSLPKAGRAISVPGDKGLDLGSSTSPRPRKQADEVQCPSCGQVLTGPHGPGNLTRHRKTAKCGSSPRRQEYVCAVDGCGKKYQRSDGLKNHMRKTHGA
ncbi:hypothetical protein M011DRAFT_174988 [Sporormia fimetaria CBS 119925]|uniref:C2H2-type domain-containing protein n=1 Tax=Sporormia fimetaria CBS 119925 TaxID=1340428 RepID=A0A6A6VLZ7_9PLEO|nr:hypothetical protein M011DRAFT_174988 [Sporormia fimetaria CBS 119925]